MTLDEAILFTKQALKNVNTDKRVYSEFRFTVEQVKQLLEWLEDYKQLKADCTDLDNRLRTANTEINRLRSVSSWIPCSVKKPEAYKSVLVVIKDNDRYTWINIGETDEDGNWMIGGEFWYSKSDTSITHWMPNPELPKEE